VKAAANNTQVSRTKTTKDNAAWKAQQTVSKLQKKTLALKQTVSASPKLGFRQIPVPLESDLAEILSVSATLAMLSSLSSRAPSLTRACVRTKNRWVLKLPNGSVPYPTSNLSYPGVVNTQSGSNFVITDQ
jgi:hypothetical protein